MSSVATIPDNFSDRLTAAMDAKGLNPDTLSKACGSAFMPRAIFRWRAGSHYPGIGALPLLCEELDVTADWLLGMSADGGPKTY